MKFTVMIIGSERLLYTTLAYRLQERLKNYIWGHFLQALWWSYAERRQYLIYRTYIYSKIFSFFQELPGWYREFVLFLNDFKVDLVLEVVAPHSRMQSKVFGGVHPTVLHSFGGKIRKGKRLLFFFLECLAPLGYLNNCLLKSSLSFLSRQRLILSQPEYI